MKKIKVLLKYSFLILVINISFLFSPKPIHKDHYCGDYFELSKNAGFVINCDAYAFVGRAMKPTRLMKQDKADHSIL